uniref:BL1S4 protein n=1 Tax=Haemonchus placei TaxID=6290 RepID=A0A0N4W3B7_HAEPC
LSSQSALVIVFRHQHIPSEEESASNTRTGEVQKKMAAKNQEEKVKPKKRSNKSIESTSAAKRTCEDAFKSTQKKIPALERQEASTPDNHLQKAGIHSYGKDKSLADHHEFAKQTVAPTKLVIEPEHVDELLKRVLTSLIEMQSSLEEQMDNAKNRIFMEMDEMFKEVDRCRTEVERGRNNAVMHEVREVSTRLAAFQNEVNERFKALKKKLDQMPDIASMPRRIDLQLKNCGRTRLRIS